MEIQFEEINTTTRFAKLQRELDKINAELPSARETFLIARTRKNFLEARLNKIEGEIDLICQGQLCLGDALEASHAV